MKTALCVNRAFVDACLELHSGETQPGWARDLAELQPKQWASLSGLQRQASPMTLSRCPLRRRPSRLGDGVNGQAAKHRSSMADHRRGGAAARRCALVGVAGCLACSDASVLPVRKGAGYMLEYPVARNLADSRVPRIYGGSNEIMKELIARTCKVFN